jgi:hypothetical protein
MALNLLHRHPAHRDWSETFEPERFTPAAEFRLSSVGADLPEPEFQINLRTQQDLPMRVAAR